MPTGPVTISFWIRWADTPPGGDLEPSGTTPSSASILNYDEEEDSNFRRLWLTNAKSLEVWFSGGSVNSGVDVSDGAWHHVVVQIEPANAFAYRVQVWRDGIRKFTGNLDHDEGVTIRGGRQLILGARRHGSRSDSFSGEIALFAVWNRILPESEIQETFERVPRAATVYWPLDRIPSGVDQINVTLFNTGIEIPKPGQFIVTVDTSQTHSRAALPRKPAPALGQTWHPGTYRIDIDGLGYLDLKIDLNGVTINGQTWRGEAKLHIVVNEDGYFKTDPYVADGDLRPLPKRDIPSHDVGVTSRSVLVEDYREDMKSTYHAYRSTVRVPSHVKFVDVFAERSVRSNINGVDCTLEPNRPFRAEPDVLSKLVIATEASDLVTPALHLRHDHMPDTQRFIVCPDIECHRKITGWKKGELWKNRESLGVTSDENTCHAVQKAVQNVARSIQYTYNDTGGGVCHDRFVRPGRMEDLHWSLDLKAEGGAAYKKLHPDEVRSLTEGVIRPGDELAQGIFEDIGEAFANAGKVIFHTVEAVGRDIVDTVSDVGQTLISTVEKVGDDIVSGNLSGAAEDLFEGGAHALFRTLKGGENLVGDVLSGGQQLLAITLDVGGKLLQFVIDHTGLLGQVLKKLLDWAGAAVGKVIAWMVSGLGWDDIIKTQRVIKGMFLTSFTKVENMIDKVHQYATDHLEQMRRFGDQKLDLVIDHLRRASPALSRSSSQVTHHTSAIERVEWLLSRGMRSATSSVGAVSPFGSVNQGVLNDFTRALETHFKTDKNLHSGLRRLESDFLNLIQHPSVSPEQLLILALDLIKLLFNVCVDMLEAVVDVVCNLLKHIVTAFKGMMTASIEIPFFSSLFREIDDGQELSVLNLFTLIIATPATLIAKATGIQLFHGVGALSQGNGTAGGGESGRSAQRPQLNETDRATRDWGIVYGTTQIVLGILNLCQDASYFESRNAYHQLRDEDEGGGGQGRPPVGHNFSYPKMKGTPLQILNGVTFLTDILAQFAGWPGGAPFRPVSKPDIVSVPGMTVTVWTYQWGMVIVNAVSMAVAAKNVINGNRYPTPLRMATRYGAIANFLVEIAHLGFLAELARLENETAGHDHKRTATYVLDPFMGLFQLGLDEKIMEGTDGYSLLAVFLGDIAFQTAYGGIYIDRMVHLAPSPETPPTMNPVSF